MPVRRLCLLALMGALMFASKIVMASLPNIHIIAFLIVLTAMLFSWEALYSVMIYVLLEGLFFGFGIWWISYLYAWPLLVPITVLFRKNESPLFWAITTGVHGLCFGAMCAIPYLFIGGMKMAFAYWLNGIPFDLLHCAGNFIVTLLLMKPVKSVMLKQI